MKQIMQDTIIKKIMNLIDTEMCGFETYIFMSEVFHHLNFLKLFKWIVTVSFYLLVIVIPVFLMWYCITHTVNIVLLNNQKTFSITVILWFRTNINKSLSLLYMCPVCGRSVYVYLQWCEN